MLTVGASSTWHPFDRASDPRTSPTRATSCGFQVAPRAVPHGTHVDVDATHPGSAGARGPVGPLGDPPLGYPEPLHRDGRPHVLARGEGSFLVEGQCGDKS